LATKKKKEEEERKKEIIMLYLYKDKYGILLLIIFLKGLKAFKQYMCKIDSRIHY